MVKIFIGNLPRDATTEEIQSLFSQYGTVSECAIIKNYAFVHMDDRKCATKAIRSLHLYKLHGVPINVEASRSKNQGTTKLHVANIDKACTNEELRALFEDYGTVTECDVVKNYAFVHMANSDEAMDAIKALDNSDFMGKRIHVQISTSRQRTGEEEEEEGYFQQGPPGRPEYWPPKWGGDRPEPGPPGFYGGRFGPPQMPHGPAYPLPPPLPPHPHSLPRRAPYPERSSSFERERYGKLMSVKLSTSRLRTAPGMGERTGCYRCGQEGHWSKECPLDQNGSFAEGPMGPGTNGFGPPRFGAPRGRGFHRGFSGDPGFNGGYGPAHGFGRGAGYGGGAPGYGRGAPYEGVAGYGAPGGYGAPAGYNMGADPNLARVYGSDPSCAGSNVNYGAVPGYPARRSPYEERDPYGVVDFYEKYRARPYAGTGYYEERRVAPIPPPPPPPPPSSSSIMRERLSSSSLDPYERRPLPPPPAPTAAYFPRDRSPIRRVPPVGEAYSYERSRLSPVSSLSRSAVYDVPRARDPYADRARYAY
ncbi:RBM4B protein, partial [Amia calva]|nr:RBM4B protein [Amia calva]